MKRSFRVATVFTGAAACAIGLAPVAQAVAVTPGATPKFTPDTGAMDCNTAMNADVKLYYASNHPVPACIYGTGPSPIFWGTGKRFASYCGGGYSGYMYIHGSPRHFTAGVAYHDLYDVSVSGIWVQKEPQPNARCLNYP